MLVGYNEGGLLAPIDCAHADSGAVLQLDIEHLYQLPILLPHLASCHEWLKGLTKKLFFVADKIGEHVQQVELLELSASIPRLSTRKVACPVLRPRI
jgi:hypothetical protein